MLIGHYAVAMGAKGIAPKTNLGVGCAAAVWLDLVWPVLVLAGVEQVAVAPGNSAFTPLAFTYYPWSHSLFMSLVWGVLFAGIYWAATRYTRGALVLAALVVSHWFLDLVVHVPDLPLTPWTHTRVGLGLWNSIPGTLIVEVGLFLAGLVLYVRATAAHDGIGRWGLIAFVVLALLIYFGMRVGPPPPDAKMVAYSGLAQWLFVALAWWFDRHRAVRAGEMPAPATA